MLVMLALSFVFYLQDWPYVNCDSVEESYHETNCSATIFKLYNTYLFGHVCLFRIIWQNRSCLLICYYQQSSYCFSCVIEIGAQLRKEFSFIDWLNQFYTYGSNFNHDLVLIARKIKKLVLNLNRQINRKYWSKWTWEM